jgi:hypothetical protein
MTNRKIVNIRMNESEKRYARALSLRVGGCKLKTTGSIGYSLKWLLHREAKKENVPLGNIYAD